MGAVAGKIGAMLAGAVDEEQVLASRFGRALVQSHVALLSSEKMHSNEGRQRLLSQARQAHERAHRDARSLWFRHGLGAPLELADWIDARLQGSAALLASVTPPSVLRIRTT